MYSSFTTIYRYFCSYHASGNFMDPLRFALFICWLLVVPDFDDGQAKILVFSLCGRFLEEDLRQVQVKNQSVRQVDFSVTKVIQIVVHTMTQVFRACEEPVGHQQSMTMLA